MKLSSPSLELSLLKTLTSGAGKRDSSKIFSGLREECFASSAGRDTYRRIVTLLKVKGELVSWGELISDPVLSETIRKRLSDFKTKPLTSDKIDRHIKLLNKYRQLRGYYRLAGYIVEEVKKEKVDVDELAVQIAEKMMVARQGGDISSWFTHIGLPHDKSWLTLTKKVLQNQENYYLPTGFKAFDDINKGLPVGLFIAASESGGGKSALGCCLAENVANYGARVCVVPLEMSEEEMWQRSVARREDISMSKLLDPKTLPRSTKKEILLDYYKWHKSLARKGGLLSLFTPQEDMTIEEILLALKPFNYDLIIVDYVGLLKGVDRDDQWRYLQGVTRFCKVYSKINKNRIFLLAQLNHEGFLANSKGMMRDASIFFRWRKPNENGLVMVDMPKGGRNQKGFSFPLIFEGEHMIFRDLTKEEKDELEGRKTARKNKRKAIKTDLDLETGEEEEFSFS